MYRFYLKSDHVFFYKAFIFFIKNNKVKKSQAA